LHIKKHIGFSGLRKMLSERFLQIEDYRTSGKVKYSLHDFFMAGFAMMYWTLLCFHFRRGCSL